MFARRSGVVPAIGVAGRLPAARWAAWSLAILIPCGVLHATPMGNSGAWQPQSTALGVSDVISDKKHAAAELELAALLAPRPGSSDDSQRLTQRVTTGCIFATHCSNPVEVPEPQSLALLTTGLLSMAGMIRRRTPR